VDTTEGEDLEAHQDSPYMLLVASVRAELRRDLSADEVSRSSSGDLLEDRRQLGGGHGKTDRGRA
jgi:hypothetical protein